MCLLGHVGAVTGSQDGWREASGGKNGMKGMGWGQQEASTRPWLALESAGPPILPSPHPRPRPAAVKGAPPPPPAGPRAVGAS